MDEEPPILLESHLVAGTVADNAVTGNAVLSNHWRSARCGWCLGVCGSMDRRAAEAAATQAAMAACCKGGGAVALRTGGGGAPIVHAPALGACCTQADGCDSRPEPSAAGPWVGVAGLLLLGWASGDNPSAAAATMEATPRRVAASVGADRQLAVCQRPEGARNRKGALEARGDAGAMEV